MAKRIFKPFEVKEIGSKVLIAPPEIRPRWKPGEGFDKEEKVEERPIEPFGIQKEEAVPPILVSEKKIEEVAVIGYDTPSRGAQDSFLVVATGYE